MTMTGHTDLLIDYIYTVLAQHHGIPSHEAEKVRQLRTVGVFGAFDTWPYMDYICRLLVEQTGCTALTSVRLYAKDSKGQVVPRKWDEKTVEGYPMMAFLRALTEVCSRAAVVFSVSAAHYVEVEWLHRRTRRSRDFHVAGVSFVRRIEAAEKVLQCRELKLRDGHTVCIARNKNIWTCMKQEDEGRQFCPFLRQGISKNIIEYFCWSNRMTIAAVEEIEKAITFLRSELQL